MTAYAPSVDDVASWFDDVKKNGTGMMAKCPVHDDRKQSLHISMGRDGNVVLKCFAGCETEAILSRVGKKFTDLFPPKQESKSRIVATYNYVDESGRLLFQSVRWDPKKFNQRQPDGAGGWTWNLNGVRRVPYHLDEIIANPKQKIWILEGEKDVDRARAEFGVVATCNAMGADKWSDDLSAMIAGRSVVIVPDNDDPGRKHAQKTAASCSAAGCKVRVLELPGVPEKGDLSDWIDAGGTAEQLKSLLDACPMWTESIANSSYNHIFALVSPELPDFPVDVFPDVMSRYIEYGAAAINVPVDMIAMPMLGFAAGVIGNRLAVGIKTGWIERPNLWIAVIGDPGSGKSPAIEYARIGVDYLQKKAWESYQFLLSNYNEQEKLDKRQKELLNILLDKPNLEHYFTTDATTQALSGMLVNSPGLVIVRDELVGWVKSHDAYNKAGDRQSFLSMWSGSPLKIDRSGADTVFIPHPCIPIVGGIQPDMLPDLADEANKRDGFVERFLMSWPDAYPQQWTDADVHPDTAAGVIDIFAKLRVRPDLPNAGVIQLSREARSVFAGWFNENGSLAVAAEGIAKGCYSKYPGQVARIALVLHCLSSPGDTQREISEETMIDAISVIEYLRAHLVRILPRFSAIGLAESAALEPRVLRVISRGNGEWVSRTKLQRGLGNSVSAAYLDEVLTKLSLEGLVENRVVPTGARPREESRIKKREERRYESMNISEDEEDDL